MSSLNILLIGLGNMGKIHKRVIENNSQSNLFGIVDTSFKKKHEKINGVEYFNEIQLVNLDDGLIDAVVISSTTRTHYKIAEKFLAKKIPVLLEKPISTEKNEIEELLNLAKTQNTIFRCGLIEIYNPIFNFIKELNLNDIISIHIYRHSQPASPERELDNVLFDLTLHDISVLGFLFENPNLKLVGQNFNLLNDSIESVDLLYSFEGINIFISTSRESQIKIRKWEIITKSKLYKIDLMQKSLDIYESGSINYTPTNLLDSKVNHSALSFSNHIETAKIQLNEFINNIQNNILDENHLELVKYSHNEIVNLNK
jgi:predicted dehydrogenase